MAAMRAPRACFIMANSESAPRSMAQDPSGLFPWPFAGVLDVEFSVHVSHGVFRFCSALSLPDRLLLRVARCGVGCAVSQRLWSGCLGYALLSPIAGVGLADIGVRPSGNQERKARIQNCSRESARSRNSLM